MKKYLRGSLASLIIAIAVIGGVSVQHVAAAYGQSQLSWFDRWEQRQTDRSISDRLASLATIKHQRVCNADPGTGAAACNAKVVLNDVGQAATSTLPNGYGPQQFLTAYHLNPFVNATSGPIIAIVDAYDHPNIANDLSVYSTTYGLPQLPTCTGTIKSSSVPCFQKLNQNNKTTPLPAANASWGLEIALDVQAAHATCQNCKILLVEANSSSYNDLLKAVDTAVSNGATVVSGSWGGGESTFESFLYDGHFNKTGVAFTFSTGDNGYGVQYPAASPYVTAVGGTSLLLNPDSTYLSETAWAGAGSGCSRYESKPSWQHDAACTKRTVADISADADPATGAAVYDSFAYNGQTGWFQVGGTSLAAPLVASVYALHGVPAGTRANALLYSQANSSNVNDVTVGSNGSCGGSYLCTAVPGFDGPTGLGTPIGMSAF